MKDISRIGIDISRSIFQVHGVSSNEEVVISKKMNRQELMKLIGQHAGCRIGMEACAGANHLGRKFKELGCEVFLMAPQYVKPYVKRNKNDRADAEAIAEAMNRPTMRFVPVKSVEQQSIGQLHRARELAVKHKTALVNEIKGFLAEYGVVLSCGQEKMRGRYLEYISEEANKEQLSEMTKRLIEQLFEQLLQIKKVIEDYEVELQSVYETNESCQRLGSIPGIGVITATAVIAATGDGKQYRSGREFSASLGLVPRQHSSGQRESLGKISKRGDCYLRKLMVQGAHSVIMHVDKQTVTKRREWIKALKKRCGHAKAAVAVANKNARVVWVLLTKGGSFNDILVPKKSAA